MERTHVVYRCFDNDGAALYVGHTKNWTERRRAHQSKSSWWPEVARVVMSAPMTKERALAIEARLIARRQPANNVQQNPVGGPVHPHMAGHRVSRTTYIYHGCRCPSCRATNANYQRQRRSAA